MTELYNKKPTEAPARAKRDSLPAIKNEEANASMKQNNNSQGLMYNFSKMQPSNRRSTAVRVDETKSPSKLVDE